MKTTSKTPVPPKPRKAKAVKPASEPMATAASFGTNPFRSYMVLDSVIPATWIERAKRAMTFYQEEPLVSNAVNAWRTFALGDEIAPTCEDEAIQEEVRDLFWALNLNKWVKDMVLQLLVKGDAIGYATPTKDKKGLARVQCVNPVSVELTLENGEITKAVQKGDGSDSATAVYSEAQLSLDRMLHMKWNVPEFEPRGQSMILPAFDAIELLRDYRRAERAIAKRWTTPLRFIQVGGVYAGGKTILPSQKDIDGIRNAIENADLRSGIVVPFYVKAETYGADKSLDTAAQMKEVKEDILVAMGLSRSIVTGDSANFATASVSMQRMIVMLKEIKQAARDMLDWVLDPWLENNGHTDAVLHYTFSDMDLTDDSELRKFLLQLYDHGLISGQSLQEKAGLSAEVETERQANEPLIVDRNLSADEIAKFVTLEVMTTEEARAYLRIGGDHKRAKEADAIADVTRAIYARRAPPMLSAGSRVAGSDDDEIAENDADLWKRALLSLFHHIHHEAIHGEPQHQVHHCGGEHVKVDSSVDYEIEHCSCLLHRIDKQIVIGHATKGDLDLLEATIKFGETCPDGGWHIESGEVSNQTAKAAILGGRHDWRFTKHTSAD